jgi:hypothetical protein
MRKTRKEREKKRRIQLDLSTLTSIKQPSSISFYLGDLGLNSKKMLFELSSQGKMPLWLLQISIRSN